MSASAILVWLFFALGPQASQDSIRNADSDWWSTLRPSASDEEMVNPQSREPAASNFRILNIELNDDMFAKAAAKLGKANKIHRGDGAAGREQICYVSPGDSEKVHLIFERGEVNFSLYLFTDGANWSGSEQCHPSKLVSLSNSTTSGLHLGQTPAQVTAILGKPSIRRPRELIYSFALEKKNSPEDLEVLRKNYAEMSDKEFHEGFDSYSLDVNIHAKFKAGKLTYLAISKLEVY